MRMPYHADITSRIPGGSQWLFALAAYAGIALWDNDLRDTRAA